MSEIKILPADKTITVDGEATLLEQLRENNIYVRSSCGGNGSCGECVFKVKSLYEPLPPLSVSEDKLLGNVYHITKERLACQCQCKFIESIDLSNHDKGREENRMRDKGRKR